MRRSEAEILEMVYKRSHQILVRRHTVRALTGLVSALVIALAAPAIFQQPQSSRVETTDQPPVKPSQDSLQEEADGSLFPAPILGPSSGVSLVPGSVSQVSGVPAPALGPTVYATGAVRTAPYYSSSTKDTKCYYGACTVEADADAATGRITASATLGARKLTAEGGFGQASGRVTEPFIPSPQARSVRATVTFRLHRATCTLFSHNMSDFRNRNESDLARVTASVQLDIACSGCSGGGPAPIFTALRLADTDPSTPAPSTIEETDFVMTHEMTLKSGQKFDGASSLQFLVTSQAILRTGQLSPLDREATAAFELTVTSIEWTSW